MLSGDHSSKQYDAELEQMRSRILQMGGLVESQLKLAMEAFETADVEKADTAIANDRRVNELQLDLDMMVNHVIARGQPTAGDLRMVMAWPRRSPTWSGSATRRPRSPAPPSG